MFKFLSVLLVAFAIALVPAQAAGGQAKSKEKVKSSSKTAKTTAKSQKAKSREILRVERDVHRLESLLAGVKTSAKLSDKSWKSVSNEADMLANRIYSNVKAAKGEKRALRTAEDLRTQIRNMKKEAHQGDYKQTRRHAERALGLAYRLDEWAG